MSTATPLSREQREQVYRRQSGRWQLTPAQARRARKKERREESRSSQ